MGHTDPPIQWVSELFPHGQNGQEMTQNTSTYSLG